MPRQTRLPAGDTHLTADAPDAQRRALLGGAAAALMLSVLPRRALAAAGSGDAKVVAVRVWPATAYTRVTIESTTPLTFKQFSLKDPERLVVDLEGIDLNGELQSLASKVGPDDPYIKLLRAARNKPGVVRLVMDLKAEMKPQVFTLDPVGDYKHRLVIDLYPAVQSDPLLALLNDDDDGNHIIKRAPEADPVKPPEAASNGKTSTDSKPADKQADAPDGGKNGKGSRQITVVLDPGHGGEDPGAVGPAGNYEKNVVLSVAKKLKALIESEPNMRVVMTRDADFFVPLGVRVKKARAVEADLFISIHADAFIRPDASGSSVFTLSEGGATSTAAKWLAKTQNDADLIGGVKIDTKDVHLARVLMDLTQTATLNDSMKIGKAMLGELGSINRLHKGSVEQASFAVLKAPDIPSILVETAFISNPDEEQRLIDEGYQQKLASALHQGVKRYFAKNPPLARTRLAVK
ncbi:N-acetylmuramoyl-L-alanine amidase [Andreprevotia lacus DSM 23236]|jgi:N-acetylmuramoyl-L-alanine amidase|uniref:N-acetylmuramoyl-L-alanine amidase AmiC n=1 Tax=Andreprevotia lacus DSM 23236 TaxID=1121001 RepID=A0A1W1XK82_9NEIS|nr:N-acetylmuramoyl-L-alanine amidase [Andreprevotia lacus]SMC24400.1 N-acetylmuramoyl-L-alanine amidase [Andreprevotia lacus DSM 23236]